VGAPLRGAGRPRAVNLRFVEAFHWVVALGSVTRAAEKLHLTQSAVSSRIAALETEVGALLLDRRAKPVRPTTAGRRFLVHAEKLLEVQQALKAELGGRRHADGAPRPAAAVPLRVGLIESVLHAWAPEWMRAMHAEDPALALELTVETSPLLVDQLVRGALDLVVAALPAAAAGVRTLPLPAMPMVFAARTPSRRGRTATTLQALAAGELLTFQRGSMPQAALLQGFRERGLEAPRLHCLSSISAMAQLVEAGFGVATLPAAVVARLAQRQPIAALRCTWTPPPLPLHLSWREDPVAGTERRAVAGVLAAAGAEAPARKRRLGA
jgi:DNA-binding transcriptional LysR family regulator